MDPRITIAWCKSKEVPIEKLFSKTLMEKFPWAMEVPAKWRFDEKSTGPPTRDTTQSDSTSSETAAPVSSSKSSKSSKSSSKDDEDDDDDDDDDDES